MVKDYVSEEVGASEVKSWRQRWLTKEAVVAWNVSSWFTLGQVAVGKYVWKAFAVKFPAVAGFLVAVKETAVSMVTSH